MKAIGFDRYMPSDDPLCFQKLEIPKPVATGRDLLVRVMAVSVNPVDTKVRSRTEGVLDEPRIAGWDVAGIVESVGERAEFFKPGDHVYYAGDITRSGGNAEYHLVDERIVGKKPESLTFEEAAAMPLTAITAWEALFDRMNVGMNSDQQKSLLVIGGAGGVGSIAIQLAKVVAGMKVIATASRSDSADWCRGLGADEIINHYKLFTEEFSRIGVDGVDYILCLNSTELHIGNMADVINPQGRICTIVETKDKQPLDINVFQGKSVGFMWELMFTRSMFNTADIQAQGDLLNDVSGLIDNGSLRTTMTQSCGSLTTENLRMAHGLIETGRTIGKIVLSGIPD